MARVIGYVIMVAALVGASVWLAERPGQVTVQWEGWRVDTSVPILLLALVAIAGLLTLLGRALLMLRRLPRRVVEHRLNRRRGKGYAALSRGFAAVAAGDSGKAAKLAQEAHAKLRDPALTALLSAQAAHLSGDDAGAREHYDTLLGRRETELAGLRGLLDQARAAGDNAQVQGLARRALSLRGDAGWAARALFDSCILDDKWAEAEATLALSGIGEGSTPEQLRRLRAVLATERAAAYLAEGDRSEALKLARAALDHLPDFVPAAVMCVTLLAAEGKDRKAAAVVEEVWRRAPHPALAKACFDIWPDDEPLRRAQRAEKLAALNPDHLESRLAMAETSLAAELWGQARNQLAPFAGSPNPPARVARLMARLEQAERRDIAAANEWLRRASEAPPDPAWRCSSCGAEAERWSAKCPSCGTFDGLAWVAPSRALVAV